MPLVLYVAISPHHSHRLPPSTLTSYGETNFTDEEYLPEYCTDECGGMYGQLYSSYRTHTLPYSPCRTRTAGMYGQLPWLDEFKYRYYIQGDVGDGVILPLHPLPDKQQV
jgi:hypothetical protein